MSRESMQPEPCACPFGARSAWHRLLCRQLSPVDVWSLLIALDRQKLVVLYGAPRWGKLTFSQALAHAMSEPKSAKEEHDSEEQTHVREIDTTSTAALRQALCEPRRVVLFYSRSEVLSDDMREFLHGAKAKAYAFRFPRSVAPEERDAQLLDQLKAQSDDFRAAIGDLQPVQRTELLRQVSAQEWDEARSRLPKATARQRARHEAFMAMSADFLYASDSASQDDSASEAEGR